MHLTIFILHLLLDIIKVTALFLLKYFIKKFMLTTPTF